VRVTFLIVAMLQYLYINFSDEITPGTLGSILKQAKLDKTKGKK